MNDEFLELKFLQEQTGVHVLSSYFGDVCTQFQEKKNRKNKLLLHVYLAQPSWFAEFSYIGIYTIRGKASVMKSLVRNQPT